MSDPLATSLRGVVERRDACLIVGAGVTSAACPNDTIATWPGLIDAALDFLNATAPGFSTSHEAMRTLLLANPISENYLIVGEYVQVQLDRHGGGFGKWLRDRLGKLKIDNTELVETLDRLDLPIISTNYDGVIEQVTGRITSTVSHNINAFIEDLRASTVSARSRTVLHVHGYYANPETVVFGSSSYQRILGETSLRGIERAISVFKALIFVGVGAGMSDPHFSNFLGWIASNQRIADTVYIMLTLAEAAEFHEQRGIVVVRYGQTYADLVPYLRSITPVRSGNITPGDSIRSFLDPSELESTRVNLDTGGHAEVAKLLAPISFEAIKERSRFLLQLERAKAYCKTNQFLLAMKDCADCSNYFLERDILSYVRAQAIKNTVLRDQEQWTEAVTHARSLLDGIARQNAGRRARCIALRSLARSLALAGSCEEALVAAKHASELSVTPEERGEAAFAEGEALRHNGAIDDAVRAYTKAEATTFVSGKTDLYIWCKLCLADCCFLSDSRDDTARHLENFLAAIKSRHEDHPIESLHWGLSDAALHWTISRRNHDEAALFAVAQKYEQILGIKWPQKYCDSLIRGETSPKHL